MDKPCPNKKPRPSPILARSLLTEPDWRMLKIVLLAGGYVTRDQATALGLRRSMESSRRRLRELVHLGFLEPVNSCRPVTAPLIYKLTARAVRALGHPYSYIRRGHSAAAVAHRLLRLQFIAEQVNAGKVRLALSEQKKLEFFQAHGYFQELLPPPDKGTREILGEDGTHLYVFYIDRNCRRPHTQLAALLKKYEDAIASGRSGLKFRIVLPDERCVRAYQRRLDAWDPADMPDIDILRLRFWPFDDQREATGK